MAQAVCAMRRSFEERSASASRLMEEVEGAVREVAAELRALRAKAREADERHEALLRQANDNTRLVCDAVARFESAVDRLVTALS
jgi:uncharacterized protein YigA (DUF484 family)